MSNMMMTRPISMGELPKAIFRQWLHSREEDAGGVLVFRPKGFPFPPSFGRDGFEMSASGRYIVEEPGPADSPVTVTGRWKYLGERRVGVSFPGTVRAGFRFEIVSIDDSTLRIRRAAVGTVAEPAETVSEAQIAEHMALPASVSTRLISYEKASLTVLESFPPQYVLHVSGVKASPLMRVKLMPLVYVRQPEFWEIEVTGSLAGSPPMVKTPYAVSLPLAGATGSCGIEVVGANRRERFTINPNGNCEAIE